MTEERIVGALEGIKSELFEIREALVRIEDKMPDKDLIEKSVRTISQRVGS